MTIIPHQDLYRWDLVKANATTIRDFLEWSAACEATPGSSMRWRARPDLEEARQVIPLFEESWWAVIVYSCFNSKVGAAAAAPEFRSPIPLDRLESAIQSLELRPRCSRDAPDSARPHRR